MMGGILGAIGDFIRSVPVEAVATIAVVIGGGGLILSGWRYLTSGIAGLFDAFGTVFTSCGAFLRALLAGCGTTVGGLIILAMGAVAIWWALILLSGR
jgi:energy-converting hydrogenase Eha subunit C